MINFSFFSSVKKYVNGSILLIIASVAALVVANVWPEFYERFVQLPVRLTVGKYDVFSHRGHVMTLGTFVNDFLMAIFFLSVGLEIKREVLCGELSSWRKALLPVIGACGGMVVPVLLFYLSSLCADNPLAAKGMAIPMATDIAFSLGVLSVFSKRVPLGLKVFLAALAVADDLGGILVIAIFYTTHMDLFCIAGVAVCVAVLVLGNLRGIRAKSFYIPIGLLLWGFMMGSGIHATIAGVILAMCMPANLGRGTKFYIERTRRNLGFFPVIEVTKADRNKPSVLTEQQIHYLKSIESASDHLISPLQDLEDSLKNPINCIIIPLFAFVNAGLFLQGMSLDALYSGVGLSVILGLVLGKFVGVFSFSWISVRLGLVQLPQGATWRAFASVCVLCGIGFTVSIFMADLSYRPVGALTLLADAKLGILCGSLLSALLGCYFLNKYLPREEQPENE